MNNRGLISDDFAKEEIRGRLDIETVVERYVALKRAGQSLKGLCPFHKEKTPSFTVNPAKGVWHCFGCGKGGDVFSFLMEIEGLDFPDVLRMAAEQTGVRLHSASRTESGDAAQRSGVSKPYLLKIHALAAAFFYRQMRQSPRAIDYFKARGLRAETVRDFRLGYAPPGWSGLIDYAQSKGVKPDALVACGLALSKSDESRPYDRFRDRIIFPIGDMAGRPIAFGGRAMSDEAQPKYLNSPETPLYRKSRVLYGMHHAREAIKDRGFVLVVEGYMDYLALYQAGIRNCAASSGTALTEEHGRLLRRFTQKVVLLFDGDKAGLSAAERGVTVLLPLGVDVSVLLLPENEDPDSYVRAHGPERFLALLDNARDGLAFAVDRAVQRHGDQSAAGKAAVVHDLTPLLTGTADQVILAEYIRQLAERLRIREELVYREIGQLRRREQRREAHRESATPSDAGYTQTIEGNLMRLLIQHPTLIEIAMERLSADSFADEFSKNLYLEILNAYSADASLTSLLERTSTNARSVVSEILAQPVSDVGAEDDLRHTLIRLERKSVKRHMRTIREQLKVATAAQAKRDLLLELQKNAVYLKELESG
jgi:DNA primase